MEKKLGILITMFIVTIIGIILLVALANNNYNNSTLQSITQKNFTMSNNTCVQVTNGCIQNVDAVRNQTAASSLLNPLGSGNYSTCAIGTASGTGTFNGIKVNGNDAIINQLNSLVLTANYTESTSCQYVTDSSSRTLLNITILLFVIGLVIGLIYYLKASGTFDF